MIASILLLDQFQVSKSTTSSVGIKPYTTHSVDAPSELKQTPSDVKETRANRDARGALVEDGKLGLVVEEARHAEALLLAQAELGTPVYNSIQAAFPLHQVLQVHRPQQRAQLRLRDHVPLAHCMQLAHVMFLAPQGQH